MEYIPRYTTLDIIARYSILDINGKDIPSVEIIKLSDCYSVDNLANGQEIAIDTLKEAKAVARAILNRNQSNYNKKNGIRK